MKHRQGFLLEFVPLAGLHNGVQPVAVFSSKDRQARDEAERVAGEFWKYTYARTDWKPGNWTIHDGHPVMFPYTPRDCYFRLANIRIFA